jgi:hypothetical protein
VRFFVNDLKSGWKAGVFSVLQKWGYFQTEERGLNMHRPVAVLVIFGIAMLAACTVTPRVSTWNSPQRFKKVQVFNAALQAGTESGWQPTSSDRETGTMSFTKRIRGIHVKRDTV